jgi:caffeoyl-CoA O-methyltransferase
MADMAKELELTPELYSYLREHSSAPDPILERLLARTREELPDLAMMLIHPAQGRLLEFVTGLVPGAQVLEVGTFTGASALCFARGVGPDGRVTCLELNEEYPEVGRPYWREAGVEDRIELVLGDATESIRALPAEPTFDLAFIDADKANYPIYVREALARLRPGGFLLIDNTLWSGDVADPTAEGAALEAIRDLNDALVADDALEVLMLPLADGLTLVRPRA